MNAREALDFLKTDFIHSRRSWEAIEVLERETWPRLIASDLVSVQPMTEPRPSAFWGIPDGAFIQPPPATHTHIEVEKLTKMRTLREETGQGMIRCKEALTLHNWDMEEARKYLRTHNFHILID